MDTPLPLVRAADHDRNAVCDQLAAAYAAGRLREDELDARLGAAVHAVTLLELRRLVSDLPGPAPVPDPRPPWTTLDVLALLTVVASLAFAGLMAVLLGVAAPSPVLLSCFVGGCVASAGGAALAHLAHRGARRPAPPPGQRPRIA